MFYEIVRILKVKRPKIVLLENVKGLLSHDRGRTFAIILSNLAELGYNIQWMVLNSKFFGVPQNRERVFIIGSIRGKDRSEILPFRKGTIEIKENNKCNKPTTIYFDDSIPKAKTRRGRVMDVSGALMANFRGGIAYCIDAGYYKGEKRLDKCRRTMVYQNLMLRRLTPIECERIQGFPEGWTEGFSDTQRYKMMGNAVTVNVIKAIAEKLFV